MREGVPPTSRNDPWAEIAEFVAEGLVSRPYTSDAVLRADGLALQLLVREVLGELLRQPTLLAPAIVEADKVFSMVIAMLRSGAAVDDVVDALLVLHLIPSPKSRTMRVRRWFATRSAGAA